MEMRYNAADDTVAIYKPSYAQPRAVAFVALQTQRGSITDYTQNRVLCADVPVSEVIERMTRF